MCDVALKTGLDYGEEVHMVAKDINWRQGYLKQ